MRDKGNEGDDERRRLEANRTDQDRIDRMYGRKRRTAAGDDDGRHGLRKGRTIGMSFRMQPKTRQLIKAIMRQHRPPTLVVLFEQMVETYLAKYGGLDPTDIPSDDEAIDMFLEERDNRDAE